MSEITSVLPNSISSFWHLVDIDDAGANETQHKAAYNGAGAERHDQRDHLEAMDDEAVKGTEQQADKRCRDKRNEHTIIAKVNHSADGQIHCRNSKGRKRYVDAAGNHHQQNAKRHDADHDIGT